MAGTVTVACKLPHGLRLQLQRMEIRPEPVMGGGVRDVQRAAWVGDVVIVNGFAQDRSGKPSEVPLVGGFGLTYGVDADFFAEWMKQNADLDAVRAGLIFAREKSAEVDGYARRNAAELSGLEPTNPQALPTEFKRSIKTAA